MDSSSNLDSSSINASKLSGFGAFLYYCKINWRPHPLARSAFQSEVVPGSRGACSAGHGLQFESGWQLHKCSETFGFRSIFLLQDKLETSSPAQFYARLSILAVAALIERLAGRQYLQHALYGVRPPDLSLRGAKRRGNLAVPYRISRKLRRNRNCLPEIAASACGLLAMTRQVVRRCTSALTRLNIPVQGGH